MTVATMATPTAEDLRALFARKQATLYKVAAVVNCHPGRLGQILSGKLPLSADLAERIAQALENQDRG